MKVLEIAKVSFKKKKNVNPFTFQQVQESKAEKNQCDCKICGEPLDVGEISHIDASIGFLQPRHAQFSCVDKLNDFLSILVEEYDWCPKTNISLLDISPSGEIVQEFHHLIS